MSDFTNKLFAAVYLKKEELSVLTRFEDVLTNAEERFVKLAQLNEWTPAEIEANTEAYIARAAIGWLKVLDEDAFQPMCMVETQIRPVTILVGVEAIKEIFTWDRQKTLVGIPDLLEFLADYPYIINGRRNVRETPTISIRDSFVMTTLATEHYIAKLDAVGLCDIAAVTTYIKQLGN